MTCALLAGCAGLRDAPDPDEDSSRFRRLWLGFFTGSDIRMSCSPLIPDLYRLVFHAPTGDSPTYQVFELWRSPLDGSGFVDSRRVAESELDRFHPADDTSPSFQATRRLALDRRHLAVLEYRLERQAIFHPPPTTPLADTGKEDGGFGFRWVISGCRQGRWFQQFAPTTPWLPINTPSLAP